MGKLTITYKEKTLKRTFLLLLLLTMAWTNAVAQISGVVIDRSTGDTIAYPSAQYKGHKVSVAGNSNGTFSISRNEGWTLTVSAIGYKSQKVTINSKTASHLTFNLIPDSRSLEGVVVKSKRKNKYTRKNNPAVELMRRVIAAKQRTDLSNHDFYSYDRYQKITVGMNDISYEDMDKGLFKNADWLRDQVELCPWNDKLILPLTVDETASQKIYRRSPHTEKEITKGQKSQGVNHVVETGDLVTEQIKDVFTDVDIYDDQIRLLKQRFTSPISKEALSFYHFYIEDTLTVSGDKCIHLQFLPANQQDFGFRGELFVVADTTLHVKRCNLSIPKRSDINFVDNLQIQQEYTKMPNGEWVLTTDDMVVEVSLFDFVTKGIVIRTTRMKNYSFDPLPKKIYKGKATKKMDPTARMRGEDFWAEWREVELTKSEQGMGHFLERMQNSQGWKYVVFGIKLLAENFVETGSKDTPSKFDIGPINTVVSSNFVDGTRFRIGGQTTANLNKHLFWKGYVAHGMKTKKNYYSSIVTYSFNKKEYLPQEYPIKALSFESTYDVMSPSDIFVKTDKDNVFTAIRWKKVDQMYFFNRQRLKLEYETDWGFRLTTAIKAESNEPTGNLIFRLLSDGSLVRKIRTTEASLQLNYSPGRTYVNSKQRRFSVNNDAPDFTLTHNMGMNNILGGQYRYNYTELSLYKRFWLGTWGKLEANVKAGAQWNQVPFPLLIIPPSNLSYMTSAGTFSLMGNMEFLNDRMMIGDFAWNLNGKLFNRIPLLKKLKWRELIQVKTLWGTLTSKNNPFLEKNMDNEKMFMFPEHTTLMDKNRPYTEIIFGVRNIFRFFEVDYVRRISYTNIPGTKKQGIRFGFSFSF